MRRITWVLAIVMSLALIIAGCGPKSAKDVVGDLGKKLDKLENYEAHATMTLQTGQTPIEYDVEVWYEDPNYYRIALTNTKKDITQIILRNEDGVYVLTPHLNKSFRFNSEWPESQGQVYLYQSLVQSIIDDKDRAYEIQDDKYMFDVAANYHNQGLARQKIWLTTDLTPTHVEVLDTSNNAVVTLAFDKFDTTRDFEEEEFSIENNMTRSNDNSVPTVAGNEEVTADFGVIEPTYVPQGVELSAIDETVDGSQKVLKYASEKYQFTIVESRPFASDVVSMGQPVDLHFTIGTLTEEAGFRSMTWLNDGVEFTMTGNLPTEEMVTVARSTFAVSGK